MYDVWLWDKLLVNQYQPLNASYHAPITTHNIQYMFSRVSSYYMNLIYRTIIYMFSSNYQPLSITCSPRGWERPTDPDVITHYAFSRPTYHSVPIPCLEIRAMLVTSYSTHAPVNLWCKHVLFWSNDMKPKTTRG